MALFIGSVMWQKSFAFRGSLPLVKCVTVWMPMLTHIQASHTDALKTHSPHKLFCYITTILNGPVWICCIGKFSQLTCLLKLFVTGILKDAGVSSKISFIILVPQQIWGDTCYIRRSYYEAFYFTFIMGDFVPDFLFMGSTGFAKEKPSLSASRMTLKAGALGFYGTCRKIPTIWCPGLLHPEKNAFLHG